MMVSAREMLREIDNTGVFEKFESDVNVKLGSVYGTKQSGHADEMTIRTDVGVITVKFEENRYVVEVSTDKLRESFVYYARPDEYSNQVKFIVYVLEDFVQIEKKERLGNE